MERVRTRPVQKNSDMSAIAVMSELTNRFMLANRLGLDTYGGDRDVYEALGYPKKVNFQDYLSRYFRQDMAKAVIDRPVKASWKGDMTVIENTEDEETPFEEAWRTLYKDMKLKPIFMRADRLTGLGRYSVLFLGLNDARTHEGLKQPVRRTKRLKLQYIKPLSEVSAIIEQYEDNPRNKRYGKPKYYKLRLAMDQQSTGTGTVVTTAKKQYEVTVHYSRVIHLTEDILEDEVLGTPRLQAVYNRLIDLEKVIGGDAEMYWRGARPGYVGKVDQDYEMSKEARDDLKKQIEEFEHHLKRVLVNEGVDYKALAQQIADPSNHVDVLVQMISAVTGIPKRILVGSERGELSSAQDKEEWISYVTSRREEQNEPGILRPFIDHLLELGILPAMQEDDYTVIWDKLFSLSDKEKIEVGKLRAVALKEYSTNPAAQYMMPFDMFLKFLMGLDKMQIEEIKTMREENIEKYGELSLKELAELNSFGSRQFDRTSETDTRTEGTTSSNE